MESENVLDDLYAYGHDIKEYVVDDPFFAATSMLDIAGTGGGGYGSVEEYENSELTRGTDYNSASSPFLKTLAARMEQVQLQLDAIEAGTLPRDGVYDSDAICPDWRDENNEDYLPATKVTDDCAFDFCAGGAGCYENSPFTCIDGELQIEDCKGLSPACDSCFPYSDCGTGGGELSSAIVESESCGSELAEQCALFSGCFNHRSGVCAFDGEILTAECQGEMVDSCKPCFPNSRCGAGEASETESEAGMEAETEQDETADEMEAESENDETTTEMEADTEETEMEPEMESDETTDNEMDSETIDDGEILMDGSGSSCLGTAMSVLSWVFALATVYVL